MPKNNYFQFKQFKITQEKAAMKVGTDGVLLGAWTDVANVKSALDVGAGTGVIALILAQRSQAIIEAVEIEEHAAEEAAGNFRNSPWAKRLKLYPGSFQEFVAKTTAKYDLVISNPPFFVNDQRSKNSKLAIARHSDLLSPDELAAGAKKLLSENGRLSVILPVPNAIKFISLAEKQGLFLQRLTEVKPKKNKIAHRYLMEFGRFKREFERNSLIIHLDDDSDFREEYKKLTCDFYLKF